MDKQYADILSLAEEAARRAGVFIREARKTGLHVDAKSRIDFVSDKDLMSESMIREMIREKFPDHIFFGEESVSGLSPEEEASGSRISSGSWTRSTERSTISGTIPSTPSPSAWFTASGSLPA